MGVRDEKFVQKLISLDTTVLLQDVVNTCRSYEATRKATAAIHAPPSQLCVTSTYKNQKEHKKTAAVTPPSASAVPVHMTLQTSAQLLKVVATTVAAEIIILGHRNAPLSPFSVSLAITWDTMKSSAI